MSFPRYESYKESGVEWLGAVPESWEVKRLKFLGEAIIGLTYDPTDIADENFGTLVLRSSNVQNSRIVFNDSVYVRKIISEKLVTKTGDILICSRNGSRALIGKNAVIDSDSEGLTFGAFMTIFRSQHNHYLSYIFNSSLFEFQSGSFLTSTVNQLTIGNLYSFEVPLPPAKEQQTIAAFLDRETAKIDALIAEQKRLIELLKEKRQSVISHAVTKGLNPNAPMKDSGIEWLGEVPKHWDVRPIKFVIGKIDSGTSVNAIDEPAQNHEIGVLKTSCVYSGIFDPAENKTVIEQETDRVSCPLKTDTLIVSRMNTPDLVGATGLVTDAPVNIYLPDRLWQVSFSDTCTAFIYFWTQTPVYRAYIKSVCAGTSSSMQNLSQDQFRSFILALPTFDEQFRIAEFLQNETAKLNTLTTEAKTVITLLQERRTALISAAVTGKIDVRGLVSVKTEVKAGSVPC